MVNSKLSGWFNQGLEKGYSLNNLKKEAGKRYSKKEIDEAIKGLNKINQKNGIKLWPFLIILLIVIASVFYFLILPSMNTGMKRCLGEGYAKEICSSIISENVDSLVNDCLALNRSRESCYDLTYFQIATIKKNAESCDKIILPETKAVCLERIK